MYKIEIFLFIVILSIGIGSSVFNHARDCPSRVDAGTTCHCSSIEISCEAYGLTEIPKFAQGTGYLFKYLKLGENHIVNITREAFININATEIWLNDNSIEFIDPEAFVRVEKSVHYLDLSNNYLTTTPIALTKLTNLSTLYLSGNPINSAGFNDAVMKELGDYIREFSFGYPQLSEWPVALHHLQGMKKLIFSGGSMTQINRTAFNGFEWMLQELWIQNTQLIAVPMALQDLKSVNELHFDNNVRVTDAGILIPAFAGITDTLQTLSLENNTLTTIPPLLLTLPNLHNLSLARNGLKFISDEAITNVVSNLTTLNLENCSLDRIPGALSKLPHLLNLDFSHNDITTIEKNDLQALSLLQTLDVSDNELQYVSKSTFHDLNNIQEMYFKNTLIYLVPEALENVPSLQIFDVSRDGDAYIECNCDLSWLYCHMMHPQRGLKIIGSCYTIEMSIQDYTMNQIPDTCPLPCSR